MAEDAEPGARHGAQARALLGRYEVVFAVTEEGEVAVRQPAEQVTMLGLVAAGLPAQVIGQPAGHRAHPRLIFDRHPYVVEHVAQVGRELIGGHLVPGRPELDVDPGLGQLAAGRLVLVIVTTDAQDAAQRTGHVAAHPQQRVHDQQDLGLVPVQFGGDRVDQVGHVVDDDVHHQARPAHRVQARVRARGPGPGPGPAAGAGRAGRALRPPRPAATARPGPRWRRAGSRPAGSRRRCRHRSRRPATRGVQGGIVLPRLVRLGQQGVPGFIRVTVRHRVHSFVSTDLIRRLASSRFTSASHDSATSL